MNTETQKVDVLALIDEAVCALQRDGNDQEATDLLSVSAAVAELIETQRDTLRMLEAANRQLGMYTHRNKRIQRARDALARVGGAA